MKFLKRLFLLVLALAVAGTIWFFIDGIQRADEYEAKQSLDTLVNQVLTSSSYVPYDQVNPTLYQATIAIEDARYYDHGAVDLVSLVRATASQVLPFIPPSGGSTIAMQVVKNLYKQYDGTPIWKAAEIVLATRLCERYSKETILSLYVNIINYGDSFQGIGQASQGYYGVTPLNLSAGQATMLAGIPQSPAYFQLSDHYEQAKAKQQLVLNAMVKNKMITQAQADQIDAEPSEPIALRGYASLTLNNQIEPFFSASFLGSGFFLERTFRPSTIKIWRNFMSSQKANILCILTALIWGGGFVATDLALGVFSPLALLCVRFVGASLLAWLPVLWRQEKIQKQELKIGFWSGLFLYIAFAFQTFGMDLTNPGMNAFLTAVYVVLVPYGMWILFHKKPNRLVLVASICCLAGIGCLSLSQGSFSFGMGDLLSLSCALFFAAQIISLDQAKHTSAYGLNAIQLSVAALCSLPFGLFSSWPTHIGEQGWLSMGYLVILSTFLCYLMQTIAQQYTSPSSVSILLATECLWANLFSAILLQENLSLIHWIGGILIFLSIILVESKRSETN